MADEDNDDEPDPQEERINQRAGALITLFKATDVPPADMAMTFLVGFVYSLLDQGTTLVQIRAIFDTYMRIKLADTN
jgi:hypothetical protein